MAQFGFKTQFFSNIKYFQIRIHSANKIPKIKDYRFFTTFLLCYLQGLKAL